MNRQETIRSPRGEKLQVVHRAMGEDTNSGTSLPIMKVSKLARLDMEAKLGSNIL
jgi:hypothetical protein